MITTINTDLEYLVDTYFNKEDWHEERLSRGQAYEFYQRQLNEKNIVFLKSSNNETEPKGYLEIWWLNKEQLSSIINNETFNAYDEDLTEGDFVYVASVYIEPEYRGKKNLMKLNHMMQEQHKDRDYVGIIYESKNSRQFKIYKKGEI